MKPLVLLVSAAVLLSGCAAAPQSTDDTLRIVATTDVYGDLAATIAGEYAEVTSLITGARDPHSFEASAQDQLAVSKAEVVIANGGGYDPFVDTLLEASGSTATVIDVAELVGLPEGANEHLWYDLASMQRLVVAIGDALAAARPAQAAVFDTNAAALAAELADLATRIDGTATGGVAATEPVPLLLLEAAGFTNLTPDAFTEAIEEGSDVPPLALQQTLDLFTADAVVLLAYNEQTASPETERVRSAAEAAGIPVLSFTETLPEGASYLSWMTANVAAIESIP